METKTCTKCGQEKPLEMFAKDPRNKSGFDSRCKACHSKRSGKKRSRKKLGAYGGEKKRGFASAFSKRQNKIRKYGIDLVETLESLGDYE